MVYDFEKLDLINDGTYKCTQCESKFQCFTEGGYTEFCPECGSRSDEFEDAFSEQSEVKE